MSEKKASELLLESAEPFDKACELVKVMETKAVVDNALIDGLQEQLDLSDNQLRIKLAEAWEQLEQKDKANAELVKVVREMADDLTRNIAKVIINGRHEFTDVKEHADYYRAIADANELK